MSNIKYLIEEFKKLGGFEIKKDFNVPKQKPLSDDEELNNDQKSIVWESDDTSKDTLLRILEKYYEIDTSNVDFVYFNKQDSVVTTSLDDGKDYYEITAFPKNYLSEKATDIVGSIASSLPNLAEDFFNSEGLLEYIMSQNMPEKALLELGVEELDTDPVKEYTRNNYTDTDKFEESGLYVYVLRN